ncbi:MAG: translation initiation factor IF-3 [Acidimicrobiia bacterium]
MNDEIRATEVRLVAPDGEQIGVKKLSEAFWLADQLGLDLVEVAPDARPPVVRLMDYGKYKYEQSVRHREARKKQTRTVIKEIKFKPKISQHDYDVKRRKAEEFLLEGDKIKVTLWFRGREVDHPELGREILDRLIYDLDDLVSLEQAPVMDGRNMTMVLAPARRKSTEEVAEESPAAEE